MSSKRRLRRNACSGKRRYDSTEVAQESLNHLKRIGRADGLMQVYRCGFCSGVHIGHRPGSGMRRG